MGWSFNPFTGKLDKTALPLEEAISHADLDDMPDVGGTNTDHDLRYWTLATDQTLLTGDKSGSFDLTTSGEIKNSQQSLGTPTYSTYNDFFNSTMSAGRKTGGAITDAGSQTVNVAAGTGFIKATDDDNAQVLFFNWSASNGIAIPTDTIRYIGVKYNSGSPIVTVETDNAWDLDTEFPLGSVINQADDLYINNNPWWVTDGITNVIERFQAEGYVVRDKYVGGLTIGTSAANTTRKPTITAGTAWSRLNEFNIHAKDCSAGSTFYGFYRDGGTSWTRTATKTDIDDFYDNDSGTLQPLDLNKYVNFWVFIDIDTPNYGKLMLIYPQIQHNTAATAETEDVPVFPTAWYEHGLLVGRIIIKQGVTAPIAIETAFGNGFGYALAADHGNLSGLTDDDHTQYWADTTIGSRTTNYTTTGILKVGQIDDTSDILSIDPNNRYLKDSGGSIIFNWETSTLFDTLGVSSIDTDNRYLYDSLGNVAIDWSADVEFFKDFTSGDDDHGRYVRVYRKEATGPQYQMVMVLDQNMLATVGTDSPIGMKVAADGPLLLQGYKDQDIYLFPETPTHTNRAVYHFGYNTALTADDYVTTKLDADGYYKIDRYDTNVLGETLNMPLTIGEAVPTGSGWGILNIKGTTSTAGGPNVQFTDAEDTYPLTQLLNYSHDNIFLNFDAYFDGAWKSSDAGSNFILAKSADALRIYANSGVAAGGALTPTEVMNLSSAGNIDLHAGSLTTTGDLSSAKGNFTDIVTITKADAADPYVNLKVLSGVDTKYSAIGVGGSGVWSWYGIAGLADQFITGVSQYDQIIARVGTVGLDIGRLNTAIDMKFAIDGEIQIPADGSVGSAGCLSFGAAQDAAIYYNATDLIIDPKVVGSGAVNLNGGSLATTGNLFIRSDTGYIDLGATANDYKIQWNGSDAVHTITAGDFVFSGGNVGIGTATPAYNLQVVSDTGNIGLRAGTGYAGIITTGAIPIIFYTGGTNERARIDNTGVLSLQSDLKLKVDSKKLYFGAGDDATITFDGDSLNIVANAVTATDDLLLTGRYVGVTGYLGVGISTPTQPVDVLFSDATGGVAGFHIKNSSTSTTSSYAGAQMEAQNGTVNVTFNACPEGGSVLTGGGLLVRTITAHDIAFSTNNTQRVHITAAGDVELLADSKKLYFGEANDASIYFDATDLVFTSVSNKIQLGGGGGYYLSTTSGGSNLYALTLTRATGPALTCTANGIDIDEDNAGLRLGEGQDGQIIFTGTSLDITSDLITATDELNLRGGTNGIDFLIGATEQMTLTDGKLAPTTDNDIDLGDATHRFKDIYATGATIYLGASTNNETQISHVAAGMNIYNTEQDHDITIDINDGGTQRTAIQIHGDSGAISMPRQSCVSVVKNGNQTIANNGYAIVTTWTEYIDTLGEFNNTTGVFTAIESGNYLVAGQVTWDAGNAGVHYLTQVYVNGNAKARSWENLSANTPQFTNSFSIILPVTAGETIDIRVYQNSGGNEVVDGGNFATSYSILKVS